MIQERVGLIIWMNDLKSAKSLEKYGNVHFVSKKLNYVVMYVNAENEEEIKRNVQRIPSVKRIERSLRSEIKTEYNKSIPDKTRFYTY